MFNILNYLAYNPWRIEPQNWGKICDVHVHHNPYSPVGSKDYLALRGWPTTVGCCVPYGTNGDSKNGRRAKTT